MGYAIWLDTNPRVIVKIARERSSSSTRPLQHQGSVAATKLGWYQINEGPVPSLGIQLVGEESRVNDQVDENPEQRTMEQ